MIGRLATLYWQAYDGTTNLCRQAEAACQYELGDFEQRFIQAGQAWNDQFRGLLAGEALLLDLQCMELVYRQRNTRSYEIIKTFSLKVIAPDKLATLKSNGSTQFELNENLFNQDYPDHYQRQIKTVALSFPAVLGPYQEVGAMLTQLSNTLYHTKDKTPNKSRTNLRAFQQVALSQGINDSGLFQLNFNDERYLPFEGTGVESRWKLAFPGWKNESANAAKTLLESLDDVIIQVCYTATS